MEATSARRRAPAAGSGRSGDAAGSSGALPNLIVVGAQKCGTSALHFYLGLHPEISMSSPKELNFFVLKRNWERGLDWYRRQFDPRVPVRGESSPNYTAYPLFQGVPRRMREVVPDAKLIYLVRDPLERIRAHWVHNVAQGRISPGAKPLRPYGRYVARSRYHLQIRRFLHRYPREQVLILDQADLRDRRGETLREVFEFLGADPGFTHPSFYREQHKTKRKRQLTPLGQRLEARRRRARRRLLPDEAWTLVRGRWPLASSIDPPVVREVLPEKVVGKLREDAERLRELTGRDFGHWSIWER